MEEGNGRREGEVKGVEGWGGDGYGGGEGMYKILHDAGTSNNNMPINMKDMRGGCYDVAQ